MRKGFYPRLAAFNIKKNMQLYLPYLLTGTCTIMMFYMMTALANNTAYSRMSGGGSISSILGFGVGVVGIFAVVFMLYTNSFLIKRRKKEFGLFNILGMEKKHIAKVLFWETVYVALGSLAAGLALGILLNKLVFLALLKILHFQVQMGFEISGFAVGTTLVLFGCVYLISLLFNMGQIHLAKPIELLYGGSVGEKEPKTRWVLTLLGVLTLGAGYYISLTTKDPLSALLLFFVAVVLVMIGTYCLFTAGSIAVLKALRRNKKYYYQPKHFTAVSGMIYRMKQNAVGLANICILSTMVLITVSTTVCLYAGMQDVLNARYPREIQLESKEAADDTLARIDQSVTQAMDSRGLTPQNVLQYRYLLTPAYEQGDTLRTDDGVGAMYSTGAGKNVYFIPLVDYNAMTGRQVELADGDILIYSNRGAYAYDMVRVFDQEWRIQEYLQEFPGQGFSAAMVTSSYYIVVKDMTLMEYLAAQGETTYGGIRCLYAFDVDADDATQVEVYRQVKESLEDTLNYGECKADSKADFYSLYGGLFFVGLFLGSLFIMATVLIIYYKQISEGYDDRRRYEIMQKVGMSRAEVKTSIHSQILTVFFLPLVTAFIHVAFAFPVVTRMLEVFSMTNIGLFAGTTAAVAGVFALLYAAVYALTARTYYRIVS